MKDNKFENCSYVFFHWDKYQQGQSYSFKGYGSGDKGFSGDDGGIAEWF